MKKDRQKSSFCPQIVPRVIALIDLGRAGISHLQRLPASITRAAIWGRVSRIHSVENSRTQSLATARREVTQLGSRSLRTAAAWFL